MEAIPTKDRESYAEGMARLRSQQSIELTAPLQNSIEIGQTAKGFLYLKSLKLYSGPYDVQRMLGQLFDVYDKIKEAIDARNG